jgi:hypothetical protein
VLLNWDYMWPFERSALDMQRTFVASRVWGQPARWPPGLRPIASNLGQQSCVPQPTISGHFEWIACTAAFRPSCVLP